MRRARSFLRLPWRKQRALLTAGIALTSVRVALRVLPFQTLRRLLARLARTPAAREPIDQSEIDLIVWALSVGGRTLPAAGRCLIEALSGYVLLGRRGVATDLRIGVARDPDGTFTAHAWLEKGDFVVLGHLGTELERYAPFPALRGLEP